MLSTAPAAENFAVDGSMDGTLIVNHVTKTDKGYQVGGVVIGQIHANKNEPIHIYYCKLPGNSKGSIYYSHVRVKSKKNLG